MSFLFPAFLIGGAAIAIPIVLHLLRRDIAPEVPFTAVHLLQRSPIERSKRRRPRDLWLLLARVVALLLLATAFARPYRAGATPSDRVAIVAVDRSFSMAAPGVFARARQLALEAIDQAGRARVAVIVFDERAEVVAPPGPAADARRAVEALAPGFGATRYDSVMARAAEVADGDAGRLVVITDLQRSGWDGDRKTPIPNGLEVAIADVGAAATNVAVLRTRVEAATVITTVRNAAATPYSGRLRLLVDASEVATANVNLPPGATVDVPVSYRARPTGTLTAVVDDAGGFPGDDRRIVLLDPAPRSRLLMVIGGTGVSARRSGFYLARALESASIEDGAYEVTTLDSGALTSQDPGALKHYAVVALLSTRGLDRRGRDALAAFVRSGGGLFVCAGPEVDAGLLASLLGAEPPRQSSLEEARPRVLAVSDLRHPIFRPFGPLTANLGQVRFDRAWRMPAAGWRVVAAFTDGAPALLERSEGVGRLLLFTSDLDRQWNDFPLHPAFVPFVLESLRYAEGLRPASRELLISEAPAGVEQTPGVHLLQDGRRVVLNVDTRESALSRLSAGEFADMLQKVDVGPARATLRAQQTEGRQSYWQYGLALMLIALVAESIVGRASRS